MQNGTGHFQPMFTVEALGYEATEIPADKATQIIQMVAKGGTFTLHYFSMYYGTWRDAPFYVGKLGMKIGRLTPDGKTLDSLSFNMTGVNPI